MSAALLEEHTVEQQAIHALAYLNDEDKHKVLEYIASLLTLEEAKHDQTSAT
jgi:flagellar motor switch protein FliG